MGQKYSTQATSGYNATPPPDDGTQTASNLISWSGIKTKIGDVLKTFGEAINTALVSAFDYSVRQISASDTTVAGDHMRCVEIAPTVTTAVTISLGDATTMTSVYRVFIKNSSARNQTLTRITGGDTLDGVAGSVVLAPGEGRIVQTIAAATGYVTVSRSGPFSDGDAVVAGGTDGTKKIRFEVDGLTAGATRALTVPDKDITLAGIVDFTGANGAGLVLLGTATASNSAALDFTSMIDIAKYMQYQLVLRDIIPATNAQVINVRFSADNGATFDSGANYSWGAAGFGLTAGPSWTVVGASGTTSIQSTQFSLSNTAARLGGNIDFTVGAAVARTISHLGALDNGGSSHAGGVGHGAWAGVANAVRLLMSSGNITSGTVYLYGKRIT